MLFFNFAKKKRKMVNFQNLNEVVFHEKAEGFAAALQSRFMFQSSYPVGSIEFEEIGHHITLTSN